MLINESDFKAWSPYEEWDYLDENLNVDGKWYHRTREAIVWADNYVVAHNLKWLDGGGECMYHLCHGEVQVVETEAIFPSRGNSRSHGFSFFSTNRSTVVDAFDTVPLRYRRLGPSIGQS